jgi:hypothetical protein
MRQGLSVLRPPTIRDHLAVFRHTCLKIEVIESSGRGTSGQENREDCWNRFVSEELGGHLTGELRFLRQISVFVKFPDRKITDWSVFDKGLEYLTLYPPPAFDITYKARLALTACAPTFKRKYTPQYFFMTEPCYRNVRKILSKDLEKQNPQLADILNAKKGSGDDRPDSFAIEAKDFLSALINNKALAPAKSKAVETGPVSPQ